MKEAACSAGGGRKMEADQARAFEALSKRFGNRFRRHERSEDDVVASVLPLHTNVDDGSPGLRGMVGNETMCEKC